MTNYTTVQRYTHINKLYNRIVKDNCKGVDLNIYKTKRIIRSLQVITITYYVAFKLSIKIVKFFSKSHVTRQFIMVIEENGAGIRLLDGGMLFTTLRQ